LLSVDDILAAGRSYLLRVDRRENNVCFGRGLWGVGGEKKKRVKRGERRDDREKRREEGKRRSR
jgi:hypothetical protein